MQKNILLTGLVLLSLVAVLGFVMAHEGVHTTKGINYNVETTRGIINLPDGTQVGGNPTNFIQLTRDRVLRTTVGDHLFLVGTKINCDHGPGQPDPCGGT